MLILDREWHFDARDVKVLVFYHTQDRNRYSRVTISGRTGGWPSAGNIPNQCTLGPKQKPDLLAWAFLDHMPSRENKGPPLPEHGCPSSDSATFLAVFCSDNSDGMRG